MKQKQMKISAIGMALFLFIVARNRAESLPLTETIYMIPEYDVEILLRDEVYQTGTYSRKDSASLGFGAIDSFSLWIQFDYLSQSAFRVTTSDIGDLFFKGKFYIGDYASNQLHLGFLLNFRFPLGRNAYVNSDWLNLALGKYEVKLGPFARVDILDVVFVHLNLFYTFREGNGEDFWGGFYFDILKKETWEKVFGLNPQEDDTFFSSSRLKNDYISVSMAWNTNYWYPFIPYIEMYGSFRVSRSHIDTGDVPIEAAKYNTLLLSAGVRYFFMQTVYIGIYTVQNPLRISQQDFIQAIYGIELSFQI
ncbi:MAG: hypothetical protein A2176_07080 [Spirochaetes bacterium RBG_13_51_14]|nr:MAG: hypothetical protein A2176_07080 [Spirochaetes bacterium RBG_13_51_14]